MSKRCKLQKEYYKEFGDYKGSGKYTDQYVKWLEYYVIELLREKLKGYIPTTLISEKNRNRYS